MEDDKLEALLRAMLVDLQHLSNKSGQLRLQGQQIALESDQIDQRIMELQTAIARLAYHSGVDPFHGGHRSRQHVQRRGRARRR